MPIGDVVKRFGIQAEFQDPPSINFSTMAEGPTRVTFYPFPKCTLKDNIDLRCRDE